MSTTPPVFQPQKTAKPGGRKQAQAAETRRKLLAAAQSLIAERGLSGTSAQAVQERSGVSRGSIFWHFGSMEGLRNAALEEVMESWQAAVLPVVETSDVADMPSAFVRAHLAYLAKEPERVRVFYVLLTEAMANDGDLKTLYTQFWEESYRPLRRRLTAEARKPRPGLDPEAIMAVVGPAIIGIHIQHMVSPDMTDLEESHRALARFLSESFAPRD